MGAVLEQVLPGHGQEGQTEGQVTEEGPRPSGKKETLRGLVCFHLGIWWPWPGLTTHPDTVGR